MRLLPLDDSELLPTVAAWLKREDIAPWIAFAQDTDAISPRLLRILQQQDSHELRAFTDDQDKRPIGVVGFSDVDASRATANLWYALGDHSLARRGYTTRAARRMLTVGFDELGLETVSAWAVEHNVSHEILERLGFRRIGIQRRCHRMNGRLYDRVLYDLLAHEHRERRHAG